MGWCRREHRLRDQRGRPAVPSMCIRACRARSRARPRTRSARKVPCGEATQCADPASTMATVCAPDLALLTDRRGAPRRRPLLRSVEEARQKKTGALLQSTICPPPPGSTKLRAPTRTLASLAVLFQSQWPTIGDLRSSLRRVPLPRLARTSLESLHLLQDRALVFRLRLVQEFPQLVSALAAVDLDPALALVSSSSCA